MVRFWFPSNTNESLFLDACERRGIGYELEPATNTVLVSITAEVMVLAEQYGGVER